MKRKKTILAKSLIMSNKIGVYSPSGAIRDRQQYLKGIDYLASKGFTVKESAHTFNWESHYSARGETKASDFHELILDPDVNMTIPSVGGHTSIQMIPFIDWDLVAAHPKIHVGFSDNSLLINLISEKTGLVTFHSGVDIMYGFGDFGKKNSTFSTGGDFTCNELFETLRGHRYPGKINKLGNWRILRNGRAKGIIKGGNLDALQALIGTPYSLDWSNSIFFWESTDDPHRVDLFFATLSLSGILDSIKGMVVGRPINCQEKFYPEKHDSIEEIIIRYTKDKHFPIIIDADMGHGMENSCIPIGAFAEMEGDSVIVLENVVE